MSERELDKILDIQPPAVQTTPNAMVTKAKNALATAQQNFDMVFDGTDSDSRFNDDFEEVRDSLKDLITEIGDGIQKLSLIAQDSEKASHFSALAQMSTALLNANKQLLEIYSEKKRYHKKADDPKKENGINVQNAVFTGTTSDLKAWIKKQQEAEGG